MTWRQVHGDLPELIEDAHAFKAKHEQMATRIKTDEVLRDSARVFGSLFSVDGNVASPMVFYLTDSTSNFLYGALYFDVRPNADSLAPVTEREPVEPLRFAQFVGLVFAAAGVAGFTLGAPLVGVVATAFALAAAFLNAAFGICLGCQIYPLAARLRRTA